MTSNSKNTADYHVSEFTHDMAKALYEHFEAHQDDEGVVKLITSEGWLYMVRPHMPHNPMCIGKARANPLRSVSMNLHVN